MKNKKFIGRKKEIDVLFRIAAEAGSGDADNIFLSGNNGIGKSELLKHLFDTLFVRQTDTVPFLYTLKTAFISVESFARDYICSYITQNIAFQKKDRTMIDHSLYSFDDIRRIAKETEVEWPVNLVNEYSTVKAENDPIKLFLFAISAPYRSWQATGKPVFVMFDDFHKMKKFCELNAVDEMNDFWSLYENVMRSSYVPHLFTGLEAELNNMFYEDTLFGEPLEVINLQGLDRLSAKEFFAVLCDAYGIETQQDDNDLIDVFSGNPLHMKNVLQAARQSGVLLSEDDLWSVYLDEVTRGKTYKYWMSLLKKYVPQFDLRKTSLTALYRIMNNDTGPFSTGMQDSDRNKFEHVINLLNLSGIIEQGFSEIRLVDDMVMRDVITGLYHREVQQEPIDRVREIILDSKKQTAEVSLGAPSFEMTVPAIPGAELVVVKLLEQVALYYELSPQTAGQIQVALIELLVNANLNDEDRSGCRIKFIMAVDIFYIEIAIPNKDFSLTDDNTGYIMKYIDDIKVENSARGSKVTLTKNLETYMAPAQ